MPKYILTFAVLVALSSTVSGCGLTQKTDAAPETNTVAVGEMNGEEQNDDHAENTPTEDMVDEPATTVSSETEEDAPPSETAQATDSSTSSETTETSSAVSEAQRSFPIVQTRSVLQWEGRKKIGGAHNGTVNFVSGKLAVKGDMPVAGKFTVDMSSIDSTDLSGAGKASLDKHLKGPDFFDVAAFPQAMVEITDIKEASGEYQYAVTADLTLKGITNEIAFTAVIKPLNKERGEYEITGNTRIDRTRWNIKYGSGKFFGNLGDKAINDMMDINITVVTSL